MYSSNRAPDILQTGLQKVPANLFLFFSWSYSVLYCWGNKTVSQSQLPRELPEEMLCPWTVKMIFHFLLLLKIKVYISAQTSCWAFSIWCNDHNMNKPGMHNKVHIIVCTYCMQHDRHSFTLQRLSCGVWVASAVQKTMKDIRGLSSLMQNHRFTQSQNGWVWMGGLEIN